MRRAGFCFRESLDDFFWRYKLLSPSTYPRWSGSTRDGVVQIMNDMGLNRSVCSCWPAAYGPCLGIRL